jgi:hypothetical protein
LELYYTLLADFVSLRLIFADFGQIENKNIYGSQQKIWLILAGIDATG